MLIFYLTRWDLVPQKDGYAPKQLQLQSAPRLLLAQYEHRL